MSPRESYLRQTGPALPSLLAIVAATIALEGCGSGPAISPQAANVTASTRALSRLEAAPQPADTVLLLARPVRPRRDPPPVIPIQRVTLANDGSEAVGTPDSAVEQGSASASYDGSYVAFTSNAGNLVSNDTNSNFDVFVRKTCATESSACTPATTRVSVAPDGSQLSGGGSSASISGDGRFVAFSSADPVIDATQVGQVFVRDTCTGAANACTPTTILVSKADDGSLANSFSGSPQISQNGRYVVFVSRATNLVAGATNSSGEIYLRDTCLNVSGTCTPSTVRIMVTIDGSAPNNFGTPVFAISSDARYVALTSDASNLVANDTNNQSDVFLRDTCLGASNCTPGTTLVSVATDGGRLSAFGPGGAPVISGNGRYVGFVSMSDLQPGGTMNVSDIFVRDSCAGSGSCTPSTTKVSVASDGGLANGSSGYPSFSMSYDGRYVVFGSGASNLVAADTNGVADVFLRDTCFGITGCTPSTQLISLTAQGQQANAASQSPSITPDGYIILFESTATNLVSGDTNKANDVFMLSRPQ